MKLTILSHVRQCDGLYDVDVLVAESNKVYSFTLASEFDLKKAISLCRRRKYGQAMNHLKCVNSRKEEGNAKR